MSGDFNLRAGMLRMENEHVIPLSGDTTSTFSLKSVVRAAFWTLNLTSRLELALLHLQYESKYVMKRTHY